MTPSHSPRRPRAGLTLVEVVVVLAIIAIAGALLLLRQVSRTGTQRAQSAGDMTAVVDSARRLAVQRQQTMRLRVYDDGLWSVVAPDLPEPIAAGTMTAPPAPLDLSVDARGICRPSAGWIPSEELQAAFDAGKCRWVTEPGPRS
ncbi:MAG: prepilin-type N-terminal cleavage/methylation domain-containing protein [Gemmatimonas sp.]|uniref:prepilin-type N-terminal cleavage/methylation domain-containing protein n=1 Tax=Gemmatimonas sp. TaxID=1962908 RepID=UPI0031BC28DF|nr:prepilin-type N-terminal cleavage/methylation domain-containing protein [Gemmatimonas sp.]